MILKTPAGLNIGTPVGIPTHNGLPVGKPADNAQKPGKPQPELKWSQIPENTPGAMKSLHSKNPVDLRDFNPTPEAPYGLTKEGKPRGKPGRKEKTPNSPLKNQYIIQSGLAGSNPSTHVKVFARPYTEEAVTILVAIMRDNEASPQVRVSAATQVLDRAWGKPKETLELEAPQEGLRAVLAGVSSSDLSDLLRAMREAAIALPVIEGTAKKT